MKDRMALEVAAVFEGFPPVARAGLLRLRALIFEVAAETPGVGRVEEALRWGQPAYLTPDTGAGSTIRLGLPKAGGFALFVNCQTSLIENFRLIAPVGMPLEGKRAVVFRAVDEIDEAAMVVLIRRALSYHRKV